MKKIDIYANGNYISTTTRHTTLKAARLAAIAKRERDGGWIVAGRGSVRLPYDAKIVARFTD